jgi:serine protease Do
MKIQRLHQGGRRRAGRDAVALAAAVALATLACGPAPAPTVAAPPRATARPVASPPAPVTLTPAQIAARATPAVVTIRGPSSLGTGFVVRADGWIATNLHVIAGSRELLVILPDRTELPVRQVLAIDDKRDLAIVGVDAKKLPLLALGDSDAVRAGDPVVAIGHPLGLEDTVSNGLVSAVRVLDPTMTVLQISAPIAPGSSGGPLFNDKGEVIGIAAAVSRQGQNLAFGVPVAYLKKLLENTSPIPFEAFAAATTAPLPRVVRAVPQHELAVLQGCADGDLQLLALTVENAIQVGAPLYNDGNFAACYHVYEGAALDAERKLKAACRGPKKALGDGRRKAAGLNDAAAQAWAMRDAFDGLMEVIARKLKAPR